MTILTPTDSRVKAACLFDIPGLITDFN